MKSGNKNQRIDIDAIIILKGQLDMAMVIWYQEITEALVMKHIKVIEREDIYDALVLNINI